MGAAISWTQRAEMAIACMARGWVGGTQALLREMAGALDAPASAEAVMPRLRAALGLPDGADALEVAQELEATCDAMDVIDDERLNAVCRVRELEGRVDSLQAEVRRLRAGVRELERLQWQPVAVAHAADALLSNEHNSPAYNPAAAGVEPAVLHTQPAGFSLPAEAAQGS